MDRLARTWSRGGMTPHTTAHSAADTTHDSGSPTTEIALDWHDIGRTISRRSFATLATVSPSGRPHAVAVMYAEVDGVLYMSAERTSRKARNIAASPHVFVQISVRRMPFGAPPSSIQFAATAELLPTDHPDVQALVAAGRLGAITGHGELDLPEACIIEITPGAKIHTYGLGMSLRALAKDPMHAGATIHRPS